MHFADRLAAAVRARQSVACVGLDPHPGRLPAALAGEAPAAGALVFCRAIVDAVADLVPAVKPNIAFFEALGLPGLSAYAALCAHAQSRGLLVIGDVKRGDIGSTAAAYAAGLLGPYDGTEERSLRRHDAVTVNPYLGSDGVAPFLDAARAHGQGLFCLVKTSNPSSSELQDLSLAGGGTVAERMAELVAAWGREVRGAEGWSAVGAVVGATHGESLARFRALMPATPFLLPGYGAQGAGAEDVIGAFGPGGTGALVNASRSVLYAYEKSNTGDFAAAARAAVTAMNAELNAALAKAGKGF